MSNLADGNRYAKFQRISEIGIITVSLRSFNIFKNVNLVFLFQEQNGLHGKTSENMEYLWKIAIDFFPSLTIRLLK